MTLVKFIKLSSSNNSSIKCEFCEKEIAQILNDEMTPSPEDCYKKGNVPIPNLGWLCSQICATDFEKKFEIKFSRTHEGIVDYYNDSF